MDLSFPDGFLWGTSTAAAQIETASDHNFKGFKAKDGHIFERTTDHEEHRLSDIDHITRFGSIYRCSVDWARLQKAAFAPFNKAVVAEYQEFFEALNGRGTKIIFVLHHFAHPSWFEVEGGWAWESNLDAFYDFCARCMDNFGDYVFSWNTFNEPNVYALNSYYLGIWPPLEKSLTKASRVLGNMARAHLHVYEKLKERFPSVEVGYSLNTAFIEGRGFRGQASAKLVDWWYYHRPISLFQPTDYVGLSYYAYVVLAPEPKTVLTHKSEMERNGQLHDDLWALKPEGLAYNVRRAFKDTGKPVWIMENGVCTNDDAFRIRILKEYLTALYGCIREGIPVKGYTHWSTWDNFEWNMGPTYRFGLMRLDLATMDRVNTAAADWFEELCATNILRV